MAINGSTLPPCDPKIFKRGKDVCLVYGQPNAIEDWVKKIAKKANARVDWHYAAGRARVLHLGDNKSRQRVLQAVNGLKGELEGTFLS